MKKLRLCADDTMDVRTTVAGRTPEVWEQHERDGHMPKFPDCPVCIQEHGSVVKHISSTTNSLHTLHLNTGFGGNLSLDGKRYFVVAGLRVQHEDKVMFCQGHFSHRLWASQCRLGKWVSKKRCQSPGRATKNPTNFFGEWEEKVNLAVFFFKLGPPTSPF